MPGQGPGAHLSSTTTLAPLTASWVAVVRPPMPDPMITASYSTSVGALSAEPALLAVALLPGASGAATAAHRTAAATSLRRDVVALCACTPTGGVFIAQSLYALAKGRWIAVSGRTYVWVAAQMIVLHIAAA